MSITVIAVSSVWLREYGSSENNIKNQGTLVSGIQLCKNSIESISLL